jgi:hypothetical protein
MAARRLSVALVAALCTSSFSSFSTALRLPFASSMTILTFALMRSAFAASTGGPGLEVGERALAPDARDNVARESRVQLPHLDQALPHRLVAGAVLMRKYMRKYSKYSIFRN